MFEDTPFSQACFTETDHNWNKEETICSPWCQQTPNYGLLRIESRKNRKSPPLNRVARYVSEMEPCTSKERAVSKEKKPSKHLGENFLLQKSVTIEYKEYSSPHYKTKDGRQLPPIKLPRLSSKKTGKDNMNESNQELQKQSLLRQNNRSSLKKYISRVRGDIIPPFEIYKRSLVAARRFFDSELESGDK